MTLELYIQTLAFIPMKTNKIYAGLSGVEMDQVEFNLGQGVFIRKTYAHLFAPFMLAFNPPGKFKHHDGPWKATKGALSFDIGIEVEIPRLQTFENLSGQEEGAWLIASLLRLAQYPFLNIAVLSDMPFRSVTSDSEPTIFPFETKHRIFSPPNNKNPIISEHDLFWLKEHWEKTAVLMTKNAKFYSAFKAFDSASIHGKVSTSLLTVWGAIEQLFSPNTGELKFRVCSNLASYLAERGNKRLELFKELSKLYNDRSTAAHTSKDIDHSPLLSSYVHLRNALLKMVETGIVPNQEDFEELMYK